MKFSIKVRGAEGTLQVEADKYHICSEGCLWLYNRDEDVEVFNRDEWLHCKKDGGQTFGKGHSDDYLRAESRFTDREAAVLRKDERVFKAAKDCLLRKRRLFKKYWEEDNPIIRGL